jgi:hypothetical protein
MAKRATKRNIWPFGKGQPLGTKTTHYRRSRSTKPASAKALAKQERERESERLERKLSDAQLEAKLRKHYARGGNLREFLTANPGVPGEQFKRCVAAVSEKGGAVDPRAVCAAAGRKRYGAKKYAALAKAGRKRAARGNPYEIRGRNSNEVLARANDLKTARRYAKEEHGRVVKVATRNPADLAAEVYEEFHGRPSEEIVTVTEKIHYHKNLASLGELRTLVVVARDGGRVTLSRFKKAILCTNEAKNQMFIRGGDQSVDPGAFGIRNVHEVETLGKVVELAYFTRKDHLGDEGGEAIYFHVAGETNENGKRKMAGWAPDLIYHTIDERLEFSGGSYTIRAEGVDK